MKSLLSIINEEIAQLQSRKYTNDNFIFNTNIIDSDFRNYPELSKEYEIDITESNIMVNWTVYFSLSQSGIDNLNVVINDIKGFYIPIQIDNHTQETTDLGKKEIIFREWDIIYLQDIVLSNSIPLSIKTLEFDFQSKKCVVRFA